MIKRTFKSTLLLMTIITLTNACGILGKKNIKKPKVKLENVNVEGATVTGATLVFMVNVSNPNDFPLEVDGLKYDLDVGGKDLTGGEIKGKTKVDALASTVLHVPIPMKYSDVFSSLGQLIRGGSTPYRLSGSAKVGLITIPFKEEGEFKFEGGKITAEKNKN